MKAVSNDVLRGGDDEETASPPFPVLRSYVVAVYVAKKPRPTASVALLSFCGIVQIFV
jgi:hypothetical protein